MTEEMRIKVIDVDQNAGAETLRGECWLDEAFPHDDDDRNAAYNELRRTGRYWAGGGAAPLLLLTRIS